MPMFKLATFYLYIFCMFLYCAKLKTNDFRLFQFANVCKLILPKEESKAKAVH